MWGMQIEVSSGEKDHGKWQMVPWKIRSESRIRGMWQAMELLFKRDLTPPQTAFRQWKLIERLRANIVD